MVLSCCGTEKSDLIKIRKNKERVNMTPKVYEGSVYLNSEERSGYL